MIDKKDSKHNPSKETKKGTPRKRTGKSPKKEHPPKEESFDFSDFPNPLIAMLHDLMQHASNVEIHSIGFPGLSRKKLKNEPSKDQEEKPAAEKKPAPDPFQKIREFRSTPREIRDYLNRFVVSQEQAKRVLSVAVCDHYNHIRTLLNNPEKNKEYYAKNNVLMIGPTGCGKTYLMRCLAAHLGVPFVKADATKYSETGYVGYDVEDMVRDLVKAANGNVALAQYGIIYIDEIDKIAGAGEGRKDISGRGVQINLLKMLEDMEIKVASQAEMFSPMHMMMQQNGPTTISTKNILFIVSGAFSPLPAIIRKRLGQSLIGFNKSASSQSEQTDEEVLMNVRTEDLVKFGFEPEFVGRFPVRVALSALSEEDLVKILTSVENGFLNQYVEAFKGYGIELSLLPGAAEEIAREAALEKTGARGLLTVLEQQFRNYKFELPGTGCTQLTIAPEDVRRR